ncbi:MAG: Ycf66 family protein [Trichodesmium sp. MAG_R04]|nr:Ycf66 family protein [Trichodesmium sp. MAG_R04]
MLTYILALAVGLGSLALYIVAFFFPEVHRKNDFIWSGIGLFYALVLWFCAGRITGAVLLGQVASVTLLGWFTSEILILRRQVTPVAEQTKISSRKSTQDNTQEKSTVSEKISIPELEKVSKLDFTESVGTVTQDLENITTEELINEVKPGKTKSELLSSKTTSDSSKIIEESEVKTTESITEENILTYPQTISEISQELQTGSSKKVGGFAQLLTPVSGILSNIKNIIQGRDSKNYNSESTSAQIQADTEKLVSVEEITPEINEIIGQTEDTQLEKEKSMVSDIETEPTTLTEIEKEAISSLTEKKISQDSQNEE